MNQTKGNPIKEIRVKHLIDYLNTLDQESIVYLDKNGWEFYGDTEIDVIKNSGLFHAYDFGTGPHVTINN